MTIQSTSAKVHWNYFLALERDLETASRYIEFSEQNFQTYSIELAHLLLAAASEVDVVSKLVCSQMVEGANAQNINDYRVIIMDTYPEIAELPISVPRYGLTFKPWENWGNNRNPNWWRSYNDVKHERNEHYNQATLQNALNAIGALLILVHRFYQTELSPHAGELLGEKDTNGQLIPESVLVRLPDDFYHERVYW